MGLCFFGTEGMNSSVLVCVYLWYSDTIDTCSLISNDHLNYSEAYIYDISYPWLRWQCRFTDHYKIALVVDCVRHEGRSWYTAHRGVLWISATAKQPLPAEIQAVESQYRAVTGSLPFPAQYPTACLLGCVDVVDCAAQDDYRIEVVPSPWFQSRESFTLQQFCSQMLRVRKIPFYDCFEQFGFNS